jgi:hypothetical protein
LFRFTQANPNRKKKNKMQNDSSPVTFLDILEGNVERYSSVTSLDDNLALAAAIEANRTRDQLWSNKTEFVNVKQWLLSIALASGRIKVAMQLSQTSSHLMALAASIDPAALQPRTIFADLVADPNFFAPIKQIAEDFEIYDKQKRVARRSAGIKAYIP